MAIKRTWRARAYVFFLQLITIFLFASSPCVAEKESATLPLKPLWTPEDCVTLPLIETSDISSDGKYSLLLVYRRPLKETDEEITLQPYSECVLINNETLKKETLGTFGHSCAQPKFIGDGKIFSYLMVDSHKNGEVSTLYVKDITSKKTTQVQKFKNNVIEYSFSPDGKKFVSIEEQDVYESENDLVIEPRLLYLQNVSDTFQLLGKPEQVIFPESNKKISGFYYEWSPDSKKIAIVTNVILWKSNTQVFLYLVDVESKNIKKIEEEKGSFLSWLKFSPDGEKLALIREDRYGTQKTPLQFSKHKNIQEIEVLDLHTQNKTNVGVVDIEDIVGWNKDDKNLLVIKQDGTKKQLYSLNPDTKSLKLIETPHLPFINSAILSRNSQYILLSGESLHHPAEVYTAPVKGGMSQLLLKKITSINKKTDLTLIKAHPIKWKSYDGLEIEGVLVYPQGYKEGDKFPLVVFVHGGPPTVNGQIFIGKTWQSSYSPAVFASQGYATLDVNFRGSNGYGEKFRNLNYKDLGGGDFKDIMSGIDYLINKGIVDPDQLFIGGASYGGFMSAWAIGQTNRFKAAIIEVGIVDWISDIAVTNFSTAMEAFFGGTYWEDYELWKKTSPLRYINNISTPTLILHGSNDGRVPKGQALQIYQALQSRNIPARLIFYKQSAHGFTPLGKLDAMEEIFSWLKIHKSKKKLSKDKE